MSANFLRPREVAAELGVSRQTVMQLIHAGQLPAWRVGPRTFLVPRRALDEWATARAYESTKEGAS